MYCVTIAMHGVAWKYMFRKQEDTDRFKNFRANLHAQDLIFDDDFGQHGEFHIPSIQAIQIEDMEQSRLVHIESMLFNARVQKGAQDRARRDPAFNMTAGVPIVDPIPRTQ